VYKVITKVIVRRLKHVLPELISPCQVSFIPGRLIGDNVVIMQETLDTVRKKRNGKGYMVIKLDLEKAYDRLRWSFIRDTLQEMRLPQNLIEVIMLCITTSTMQILWNGDPTEQFAPLRRVRQGDPLSPYLFVACMKRLSQYIEELVRTSQWRPISICKNGPEISHLMFADDIILFAEATVEQAKVIKQALDTFCEASGQKVSASKSKILFSPNTLEYQADAICHILEMTKTNDLGKYLGVPTIKGRVTRNHFQYVLDRIDRKFAGWKTKCFSLAGCITLIQSTIESIPAYVMQTMKLPRSICDEVDRKTRRFLWGGHIP